MSKIEQIISEIEEYLDGCKPQAFSTASHIAAPTAQDKCISASGLTFGRIKADR